MSALVETPLADKLRIEFQDEDYRYAYDEEFSNSRMATQLKVIREKQELKQTELAELAGMKQSRISALEDVNYNAWSVSTLRRLARALGVRFFFGFESWGELLPEIETFGRKALERPRFEKDPEFKPEAERSATLTKRLNTRLATKADFNVKIIDTLDSQVPERIHIKSSQMPRPRQIEFSFKALREVPTMTTRGTTDSRTHTPSLIAVTQTNTMITRTDATDQLPSKQENAA